MTREKKVYEFSMPKVKSQVVTALRRRNRQATVADLMAQTTLPKFQVEEAMKVILNEYYGQLRVTESGEVLYYFPEGMRNRVKGLGPSLRRAARSVGRVAGKVLSFLFKIWIAFCPSMASG